MTSVSSYAQDDFFEPDPYAKVRLGFTAPTGFYRQVLIGFQSGICTEGIDPGYDAVNTFDLPCDMYFYCDNTELFIQGVGTFSEMNVYPLGVTLSTAGNISIALESVENLGGSQGIYIHDAQTATYHNLKNGSFQTNMEPGTYNDRFSLRFYEQAALATGHSALTSTMISYSANNSSILIRSELLQSANSQVELISMGGHQLKSWSVTNAGQNEIGLPAEGLSSGIYIVRLHSIEGTVTKKIAVR